MQLFDNQETIIVLDFETTGMYPDRGDRAIEIGAVKIVNGEIRDRFQSLINPGFLITREIESITGISNLMLSEAPASEQVMDGFCSFIGSYPLVAHNASFDQKFLDAELRLFGKNRPLNFGCTLQIARRVYPDVINYKLETLIRYKQIPVNGDFHRALADAEMTAALWNKIISDLKTDYQFEEITFETMKKIGRISREDAPRQLSSLAEESRMQQVGRTGSLF